MYILVWLSFVFQEAGQATTQEEELKLAYAVVNSPVLLCNFPFCEYPLFYVPSTQLCCLHASQCQIPIDGLEQKKNYSS